MSISVSNKRMRVALLIAAIAVIILQAAVPVLAVPMSSEQQEVKIDYNDTPTQTRTPSIPGMVLQLVLALALIVFLAWGCIKLLGNRVSTRLQGRWIKVLDEVVLGQNRGIAVLEIGGQVFLAGITDHQITMLLEIEDKQLIEEMIASGFEPSEDRPQVLNQMAEWIGQRLHPRITGKNANDGEFRQVVNEKVRTLERMADRVNGLKKPLNWSEGDKND